MRQYKAAHQPNVFFLGKIVSWNTIYSSLIVFHRDKTDLSETVTEIPGVDDSWSYFDFNLRKQSTVISRMFIGIYFP